MVFEKINDNSIQVKYLDSENKPIPIQLKQILNKYNLNVEQLKVEHQKYSNCGPEVIENFILYLTGKRVSQEKAIELHSKLVENTLLNIDFSNIYLLFEEFTDNYCPKEDYLNQHKYCDQFYNDDQQLDLLGDLFRFT